MAAIDALSRRAFLSLAGAAVTAGCAGMGGGVSVKSGTGPIAFWSNHPGQSTAVEKELIARFGNQYPELSVKLIDAGKDYDEVAQKFNAALIGTDVPDVVVLDDIWWFHFALSGVIAPLDDLFGLAGVDTGDYVDSLLADYEFDGRHYALPYARSTPLFYYNKPLWQAAGLPDRGPTTWHEFERMGSAPAARRRRRKIGARLGQCPVDLLDVRRTELGLRRRLLRQVDLDVHRPGHHCGRQLSARFRPHQWLRRDIQRHRQRVRHRHPGVDGGVDRCPGRHHQRRQVRFRCRAAAHRAGWSARLPDGRGGPGDPRQALRRAKTQRAQVHRIRHQPGQHRLFQPAHRLPRRAKVRRA